MNILNIIIALLLFFLTLKKHREDFPITNISINKYDKLIILLVIILFIMNNEIIFFLILLVYLESKKYILKESIYIIIEIILIAILLENTIKVFY